MNIYDQYPKEKVVGVFRMTTPCLMIRDLDIIKDFDCFSDRGIAFSEDGLGSNLFHAESEMWRVLRTRFTPLFTSGKLKNMLHFMNEKADNLIKHVDEIIIDQQEQDIYKLVQKYTIATISAGAFGLDIDTINDKMEAMNRIDEIIFAPRFANELDMMYPGILKKLNRSLFPTELKHFFEDLVKTAVQQKNGKPSNKKDFMDLLLELRQKGDVRGTRNFENETEKAVEITDSIMTAQAFILYAPAAYETSATTMSFMLYDIAKNPKIQDKIFVEIDDVLRRHNGEVTYETLNDMKYMQKAFDETLRMYPLIELLRKAQMDYRIPGTDVVIKKNQIELITPIGIHYDPKYFHNPANFDPDRFSIENLYDRHPCAYIPFGIRPRNCIGIRFAKAQSRLCVAKLLHKYRVELSKNTSEKIEFSAKQPILRPIEKIYLNIIPR